MEVLKELKVGGFQRISVKTILDLTSEFPWSKDRSLGLILLLKARKGDQRLWKELWRHMLIA